VYSEMKNVKRKRITVFKDGNRIFNRGYMMDLILEGDADFLKFAYDCGLGEKNSMGFGLIDIDNFI
jgi:CRISPR-associated endoribonuclease Cas6